MSLETFFDKLTKWLFAAVVVMAVVLFTYHYSDSIVRYVMGGIVVIGSLGFWATGNVSGNE